MCRAPPPRMQQLFGRRLPEASTRDHGSLHRDGIELGNSATSRREAGGRGRKVATFATSASDANRSMTSVNNTVNARYGCAREIAKRAGISGSTTLAGPPPGRSSTRRTPLGRAPAQRVLDAVANVMIRRYRRVAPPRTPARAPPARRKSSRATPAATSAVINRPVSSTSSTCCGARPRTAG